MRFYYFFFIFIINFFKLFNYYNLDNELKLIKKNFFQDAFFDLSIISKLIVFAKDNQIVLSEFKSNLENNFYNKNLKSFKNRKQLKLNQHECITSIKMIPFYSNQLSTIFTFTLIGLRDGIDFKTHFDF